MTYVLIIFGIWALLIAGCCAFVVSALITLYKRQWRRSGTCFAKAFVCLFLSGLIPCPHISRINKGECASNLSKIGRACFMHTKYHNKDFPPSFLVLTNYYADNPKLFICPWSGNKPGPIETVEKWSDYILVTNLSSTSDSDFVLAYCKPENHKKHEDFYILFADFSVVPVKPKDFGKIPCDLTGHSRINKKLL